MTVVPRATMLHEKVLSLGGISFCRYATRTAWSRLSLFLTCTMFVHILKGTKIIHRPGEDLVLGPGQGFVALKGAHLFSEILEGEQPYESLLWYIDDHWLSETLGEFRELPRPEEKRGVWSWTADPPINHLISSGLWFFDTPEVPAKVLRGRFTEILWHLSRQPEGALALGALQQWGRLNPSVVQVLEENFAQPLSLNDLAQLAGRSRASLVRDVRALTGVSPMEWILQRRLSAARQELLSGPKTVTEIALDLGFSTPAQFSTAYKRQFGRSPLQERKTDPDKKKVDP